jgi:hypothetical protein
MNRTDRNWNGGCETITRTGKRVGLKCNGRFYGTKNVNGKSIKSCYMHRDGRYQDVENEESFYEDRDEINESDLSFIAPEDDGTVVMNGRVFSANAETNSETEDLLNRERENHDKYELPYIDLVSDSESEYVPEDEETEEDGKMEFEAQGQEEDVDMYWRDECFKEKQKKENLEVLLMQERNKLEEYKKIITESLSDSDDEKLKVLGLKNRVSELKKQVMELFEVLEENI